MNNKQQLAVYNGRETSEADACSNTGHRVHFYPTEYLTYGNGGSALITTRPDGKAEYKIVDHLGSTRVVLNDMGTVLSQYDYEPFGKPLAKRGLDSRKSYIDKEKDYESGLGNYGVRSYDDSDGRFTSIDPLWEKYRAWSVYNYCGNNPLSLSDPSGMFWGPLIGIGIAIVTDIIAATQLAIAPTFDKEGDAKRIANSKEEIAFIGILAGGMGIAADATLVKGMMKFGAKEAEQSSGNLLKNILATDKRSVAEQAKSFEKSVERYAKEYQELGEKKLSGKIKGHEKAIEKHLKKIADPNNTYKSQMEGTVRNADQQIRAIQKVLKDKGE